MWVWVRVVRERGHYGRLGVLVVVERIGWMCVGVGLEVRRVWVCVCVRMRVRVRVWVWVRTRMGMRVIVDVGGVGEVGRSMRGAVIRLLIRCW
jgi:hypothetical protein